MPAVNLRGWGIASMGQYVSASLGQVRLTAHMGQLTADID